MNKTEKDLKNTTDELDKDKKELILCQNEVDEGISYLEDEEEEDHGHSHGAPTPRIDPGKKFLTPAEERAKEHKEQSLFSQAQ